MRVAKIVVAMLAVSVATGGCKKREVPPGPQVPVLQGFESERVLAAGFHREAAQDAAIGWFERAYRESKGSATRFQWGTSHVNALVRMAPQDDARIQKAAVEVLGELDGPDRLYRRTRTRLDKLEINLRKWNDRGAQADTVAAIRKRMDGIRAKIPAADSACGPCGRFLAKSA